MGEMLQYLMSVGSVALLVLGFGFVVFWHELGHFLAAKAVGIKVEQFAVGMGNALVCWRKGIGFTMGSSAERFRAAIEAEWERRQGLKKGEDELGEYRDRSTLYPDATTELAIARELGLGETEYRLNYLPLGGYVKMLGQDDMDATHTVDDPRSYNRKPVSARMLVIVAGVIMNIFLAAALFMGLFLSGFNVPPAIVGIVAPGSPAQAAGIRPGDRIREIDGTAISDATKVPLNIILAHEGDALPIKVERDGKIVALTVTPRKSSGENFLQIGTGWAYAMRGPPAQAKLVDDYEKINLPTYRAVMPGDEIVAVNGAEIPAEERGKDKGVPSSYVLLARAAQTADGEPIKLTLRGADGSAREASVYAEAMPWFGSSDDPAVAGAVGRPMVATVDPKSTALGKLLPGDKVISVQYDDHKELLPATSSAALRKAIRDMADRDHPSTLTFTVVRDGKQIEVAGLSPTLRIDKQHHGLGVAFEPDLYTAQVAGVVPSSAADRAGLTSGSRVVSVGGKPVENLFQYRRALLEKGGSPVEVVSELNGEKVTRTVTLSDAELSELRNMQFAVTLALDERIEPRKTGNPVEAMRWGVAETRDLILQGYVTIRRMTQGSVPSSSLTGPLGIFHMGGKIAVDKSLDWTIWFLAMISANLAVVNFLPIPIVDGGQFLFLCLEKLMGRPLSAKSQGIAQIAGLAIIAGVFLFVTWNDISRMLS